MKKIRYFFKVILIVFIIDFLLTFFIFSKLNFYDVFYPNLEHRIANDFYHHSFKKNVNTYDYWGEFKYKFVTNSLGFKDSSNRVITNKKNTNIQKRIIINGDSFTEGIGFEYDDTFVGLLDKKLSNINIEILNAAVASQSPILYLKKIQYLLEVENFEFDELIIFLDISDIPDDFYYNKNFNEDYNKNDLRNIIQEFFLKNFSTYLFLDLIFTKLNIHKENLLMRYDTAEKFKLNFFEVTKENIYLNRSINVERGNWINDDIYWQLHGIEGRSLAQKNLNKLFKLCNKYNIKFTLVIYPWPNQIYSGYEYKRHQNYWKEWAKQKNIKFINLFDYFVSDEANEIIKKYFIAGDIHWNKEGHRYISDIFENEYFE